MNKLLVAVVVAGACISGCTTVYRTERTYTPPAQVASGDIDLVPPVPSFSTVTDCELAYGVGACGTGAAVYETAGIAVPVGATEWYVPFAFGVMTGVLINDYFAPPGVYVADFEYQSFTSTAVINTYKTVNQTTINNYRQAPVSARNQAAHSGPVRYSPSTGTVTRAARLGGSAPRHAQISPSPGAASAPARRMNPTAAAFPYNRGATSTASSNTPAVYNAPRPATMANSYSANSYSPRSASNGAPSMRTATPAYTPARPTYTSPRPATTRSAPQSNASNSCKGPHCR